MSSKDEALLGDVEDFIEDKVNAEEHARNLEVEEVYGSSDYGGTGC